MLTASRRRWGILGIGLGEALIAINFSIVSTALATIHREIGANLLELQWMLNIFGVFLSASLVTMGRLADIYGRRKLYIIGLIGAGIASFISGCAPKANWIIFAQMLQGVFGAILLAGSQALLSHLFPDHERSRAIGIWAAIAGITLGLGPLLGGAIISFLGWRWIFFINIPITLLAIFFVLRYVNESKSIEHEGEIDWWGMLLLAISIAACVVGIIQGPSWGWLSLQSIICFAIVILAVPTLIIVESKVPFPIINPHFFMKKYFLLPALTNFCLIFLVLAMFFFLPLYFQTVRNDTPLIAGLLMLLVTGPVAIFSTTVSRIYSAIGAKALIFVGFLFLLLSVSLQFLLEPTSTIILTIGVGLALGIGWVLVWGPSTTAAVSSLPKDVAGLASGAFTTIQEVGATLGLTITGTIFRSGKPPFMVGYQHALWVLLIIVIIGMLISLGLKKIPKPLLSHQ